MKLRFHSNSLRLRLSQPDVDLLAGAGLVQETIAVAPGQVLSYSLELSPAAEVTASFEDGRIRVMLPRSLALPWIDSDQTGIDASSASLRILIEKDFQCLHRDSPQDAGAFPNPLAHDLLTKPKD